MIESPKSPPRDAAKQARVLMPLLPLVERFFERTDELVRRGWTSFVVPWEFQRALCTEEEWRDHIRYLVETNKEALLPAGAYRSPLIGALRATQGRDARILTTCHRRVDELQGAGRYWDTWLRHRERQLALRADEIGRFARFAPTHESSEPENARRASLWERVAEEEASSLGFRRPPPSAGSPAPGFRRPLTGEVELWLDANTAALGSETGDARSSDGTRRPIGSLKAWLAFAPARLPRFGAASPDLVFVPTASFLPYEDAYGPFWSLGGLEVNARAWFGGLRLIWPELLPRLLEGAAQWNTAAAG